MNRRSFWVALLTVIALDQFTKKLITNNFLPAESRIFIPHLVWWTYVQNRSGAFGLFGNNTWFLIVMAIVVLAVFWYAFGDLARRSTLVRIAFGGIVGGAIGNIIDRLHHAYVVDFIDFHWWPVFNAADSCITIGVGLLVIASIGRDRSRTRRKAERAESE